MEYNKGLKGYSNNLNSLLETFKKSIIDYDNSNKY